MNKEELIEFLKDNLEIEIDVQGGGFGGELPDELIVMIVLCGETITTSKTYL